MDRDPPMQRARRAKAELYRRLVLEAAERVFAENGVEGAKIQDVAAEAGLSLGTLYGVFPGKAELFLALHEERTRDLLGAAADAVQRAADPVAQLEHGVRAYVHFLTAHPDYLRIHLRERDAWGLGPADPGGPTAASWREGRELIAQVMSRCIESGAIRDEDPLHLARLMMAAHQVFLAEWLDAGGREDPDGLAQRMLHFLWRAFGEGRSARERADG